jgi:hypothetical protein
MFARPRNREPDLVGKRGEKHLVAGIQALHEQLERAACIGPPRVVDGTRFRICCHAAADVEQNAEAHRHALGAELDDFPPFTGIDNFELFGCQARNETAGGIGDGLPAQ